eukprot:gnl/TRDRNA2_/TRDRNA2_164412_c2_seq1.p2 gnl/TRDRNA2_/TRDRNA2_164412_c2~~gnl/TRDRNA2_/TRDRNA2_164412_c2_seq1.p2  ORF type:complete len:106 (-),score=13.64 gnl/TRDRNA2_/TRDRNA2_164412_c2_seq1:100-417(-)
MSRTAKRDATVLRMLSLRPLAWHLETVVMSMMGKAVVKGPPTPRRAAVCQPNVAETDFVVTRWAETDAQEMISQTPPACQPRTAAASALAKTTACAKLVRRSAAR